MNQGIGWTIGVSVVSAGIDGRCECGSWLWEKRLERDVGILVDHGNTAEGSTCDG